MISDDSVFSAMVTTEILVLEQEVEQASNFSTTSENGIKNELNLTLLEMVN